jgi:hypothetical protein
MLFASFDPQDIMLDQGASSGVKMIVMEVVMVSVF